MRHFISFGVVGLAVAVLSACGGPVPGSGFNAGSGEYAQHMRAQTNAPRAQTAGGPQPFPGQVSTGQTGQRSIGQEAVAAVRGGQMQGSAGSFPDQFAAAAPQSSNVNPDQFTPRPFGTSVPDQLVERDFVPMVQVSDMELTQPGGVPNLFTYALSSRHAVGQQQFNRTSPFRWRRSEAACAAFGSQDLAQEAFLAAGGPERDPNHLDPDGDGFACRWDPTPFRQAAQTVRVRN